ncbi:arylsulfatase [Acinetobacter lwoffii]|uniref:Arylsulfatase n=1 Tax=Acinetobacter lwoffii TaxID=28090 RepID=A0AAW8AY33_ACILW|nr:arylsulfatase [Acinetobacter lwoffii]MDP1370802.1 arylsulfatase [Acinetobacter lwoffii]MDP1390178.1 arylsulfatase [Acinetobacter lwoffii]MDP1447840.1 arylsulfatase [Acinetobacter lwoffii]
MVTQKLTLLALFLPTLLCNISTQAAPAKQPNVLVIVADDLGFSDIQPFGGEISTPNLKKLAKEGAVLSNFHAGPTCSVTRSMLLTGNDSHQAGLGSMAEFLQPEQKGKPGYEGRLNNRVITLAEILKPQGYASFVTGKWHLGATEESNAKARGFDRSFTLMPGGAAHMDASQMFPGNYKARYLEDGKDVTLPKDFYSSDFFTSKMLAYLENDRKKDQPFFGYLAFTAPHWPLQAPDQYLKKYDGYYKEGYEKVRQARLERMIKLGIMPKGTKVNNPLMDVFPAWDKLTEAQKKDQTKTMQIYAAMIDNMDHNIGRVVNYLKQTGELDNTLILFMSDNGAESATPESLGTTEDKNGIREWVDATFDNSPQNMGKKGSYVTLGPQWAQVASTPLPYFKSILSNGGIHVPAIIRYPTQIKAGQINSETIHVIDFVPTILELTGATRPDTRNGQPLLKMEGRSFLPLFKGKALPERTLGWEFNTRRALYKGDWAVQFQAPPYGTGEWELYNRKLDPSYRINLASKNPSKTQELAQDWAEYAQRVGVVEAPVRYKYGQMNCFYDQCIQPDFLKNLGK